MAPALLNIGGGAAKSNNYDSLAALNTSLFGANNSNSSSLINQLMGSNSSSNSLGSDKVSLNYKSIGDQMVNDMAALTAETIKANPKLDGDYVIAIIDNGKTREARVYSRKEILDNFEGTASAKKSLESELAANPLMVFTNGNGLPATDPGGAYQDLAKNLNDFLKKNNRNFNTLISAGYDPLDAMLSDSGMKRILADCAEPQDKASDEVDKKSEASERAKQVLKDLKKVIKDAVDEKADLKDYVVAIVEEGGTREAKVYSRTDVLNRFVGTEEEKKALEEQLKANPLVFFTKGAGLEESTDSGAYGELASALNDFLDGHKGELDELDGKNLDPLAELLGGSTVKKALANYSESIQFEEEQTESA